MRSRDFNKRVQFWTVTRASDGYGGYEVSEALVTSSWAKIETLNNGRLLSEFGISESDRSIKLTLRKREDIDYDNRDHFLVYRGKKYSFAQGPINENFEDRFVSLIAVELGVKSNVSGISFTAPVITVTDPGD